jgi:hypothetical protein
MADQFGSSLMAAAVKAGDTSNQEHCQRWPSLTFGMITADFACRAKQGL